jgi:hypothetical protein
MPDEILPTDIEVAPGIYQSKDDYEANMAYDEMKDEQTIDELLG